MSTTPLAVLDLTPVVAGSDKHQALRNVRDLAAATERFGYSRYWFAEHHLNAGVIGVSPAVSIALAGEATTTIRLGAAGVQLGHRTPLATVEEFGLLDAAFPGRIDLGIGRSPGRAGPQPGGGETDGVGAFIAKRGGVPHTRDEYTDNGLLLPKAFDPTKVYSSARLAHLLDLIQQPGAWTPAYADQVKQLLELLDGTHVSEHGIDAHAHPGEGSDLEVWVLGASGGDSAEVAGALGLPFVAGYHHSPSTVIDAVEAYRTAFEKYEHDHEPVVSVSADVVVAPTEDEARELAAGYGPWVLSIRSGRGAIGYPTPADARAEIAAWGEDEHALVDDRVRTQFVGTPAGVAEQLRVLREATGATELAITTLTHEHADRVRSYELLAKEWFAA